MDETPVWLDERQQRLWRRWLRVGALLPAALNRDLQADGLSLPDFDVLVNLSEAPGRRRRTTALAEALQWEQSRVSHHVARMERRHLVRREPCADDARGTEVVLTPRGRQALESAAPRHARTVLDLFFAPLDPGRLETLDAALAALLARLEEPAP